MPLERREPLRRVESGQVSWFSVHEFVQPRLDETLLWPLIGTPAWCALDDHDPAKWAAVLDASQQWALRLETLQEGQAVVSHAISASADWSAIARRSAIRTAFYDAHPWLRRVSQ